MLDVLTFFCIITMKNCRNGPINHIHYEVNMNWRTTEKISMKFYVGEYHQ